MDIQDNKQRPRNRNIMIIAVILGLMIGGIATSFYINYSREQNAKKEAAEERERNQIIAEDHFHSMESIIMGPYRYYDYRTNDNWASTSPQRVGAVFFVIKPGDNYRITLVDYDGNPVEDPYIANTARYMLNTKKSKVTLKHEFVQNILYETVKSELRVVYMEKIEGAIPNSVKTTNAQNEKERHLVPEIVAYSKSSGRLSFINEAYSVDWNGRVTYWLSSDSSQIKTSDISWITQQVE